MAADDQREAVPSGVDGVPDLDGVLGALQQGDWLGIYEFEVVGPDGSAQTIQSPHGVAIVTQTCDLVRQKPEHLIFAPVVTLDPSTAQLARKGRTSRYAEVPGAMPGSFADLSVVGSLQKTSLVGLEVKSAGPGTYVPGAIQRFGYRVGRRFWRVALPTSVVPWLQGLQKRIRSAASKGGPEAAALDRVEYFRIREASESPWDAEPYEVTLEVIVAAGELLPEDFDGYAASIEQETWLRDSSGLVVREAKDIAARLFPDDAEEENLEPAARAALWQGLAESWASECRPPGNRVDGVARLVDDRVGVEVYAESDYTLDRYKRSEELDLDDLSN